MAQLRNHYLEEQQSVKNMIIYSYRLDHDLGLAPNPFGKFCTLTVCKPDIRKSKRLKLGDWIIGTGSKALEGTTGRKLTNKLIYAMRLTDRISLESYWSDSRFQYKKPIMNGTLTTMFGDNFYYKDEFGNWIQEDSAHSNADGSINHKHLKTDTKGNNALISEHFYYFGDNAPIIPKELSGICHSTQGQKILDAQLSVDFVKWIASNFHRGRHGSPLNWNDYNQLNLF
jgi:Nucleotide modification associated domain 2